MATAESNLAPKAEVVFKTATQAKDQMKKAANDAAGKVDVSAVADKAKVAVPQAIKEADAGKLKQKAKDAVPEQVKDTQLPSVEKVQKTAKDASKAAADTVSDLAARAQQAVQSGVDQVKPAMDSALGAANEKAGHIMAQPSKAFAEARSAASNAASASSAASQASQAIPTAKGFAPALPELPAPPASGDTLPANRKRKPTDFPAGSPQSKGVKFQDGLMPGEGKDGEKIIRGVDRHEKTDEVKGGKGVVQAGEGDKQSRNAVERTIWTFVMIGGFIGECAPESCNSTLADTEPWRRQACFAWVTRT